MKDKGQMFLIAAAIIITSLVILISTVNFISPNIQKRYIENSLENKIFENVKKEIAKVPIYSFYTEINENVLNFLQFLEKYLSSKGFDFNAFYMSINYSGGDKTNISIINFFDNEINVTIVLNSSPEQLESFIAEKNTIYNVTFSVTPNSNYNLNIKYEENEKNITFNTSKPSYKYFFDLVFASNLGIRRWKEMRELDLS
jgi:hypothetical protein